MRRSLVLAHRWTGIIAGLYLAMMGLTGAFLVFAPQLYTWEFGASAVSVPARDVPYATPDLWLAKAEAKYGKLPSVEGFFGPRATPMRISAPTIVYTPPRADGSDAHGIVTVDPYTGEPLANFIAEDSWSLVPLTLHLGLFLPTFLQSWVQLALGILVLGFAGSGLWLWWPGRQRIRPALVMPAPRSPVALRRLHAAIGAWSAPLLVVAAITGIALAQYDIAEAVTAPLGRTAAFVPIAAQAECATRPAVSAGEALVTARALLPGHEMAAVVLPHDGGPFLVSLRQRGGTMPARGDSEIMIDSRCGLVLHRRLADDSKPGDVVLNYMVELHNGRLLGIAGEGLVLIGGLALVMLPIAGLSLWLWKRRRRQATAIGEVVASRI